MIDLFQKELERMEHEVRDLKTCHQLGAGTTKFYRKVIDFPPGTHYITYTFGSDEPLPALCVLLFGYSTIAFAQNSTTYEAYLNSPASNDVQVVMISSIKIESAVVHD